MVWYGMVWQRRAKCRSVIYEGKVIMKNGPESQKDVRMAQVVLGRRRTDGARMRTALQ